MTEQAAFISHCHLAPCVMAKAPVTGEVLVPDLLRWAASNHVELVQMRCPETEFAGRDRQPHGRAFYDKAKGFRPLCRQIAAAEAARMKTWPSQVIAVIGVTTSPACGTNFGNRNPYQPSGIFMEELRDAVATSGLKPSFVSVWPKHQHKTRETLNNLLPGAALALFE